MKGRFIVVFGPTGVGKGTLVSHVRESFPEIICPKTTSTRTMRPGESEGSPYNFVTVDEFKKKADAGEFIEWAIYSNNYYGTPLAPITNAINEGKVVLKELEVQGVRQLLDKLPRESLFIVYIDVGSWTDLERRIRNRAPISDEDVEERRKRYEDEHSSKHLADVIIANEDGRLEEAQLAFKRVIQDLL